MAFPEFNEETILALANGTSYSKGVGYARRGAIQKLVLEGETYRAKVQGYLLYDVRIWEQEGDIGTSCTCPFDWGGICKHVVAVMVRLLAMQNSGQAVATVNPPVGLTVDSRASLDDLLKSTSHAQLKSFIRQQATEFPKLVSNLRVFAQGTKQTDKNSEDYRLEVAATLTATRMRFMNSHGYDQYVDSYFDYTDDDHVILQEDLAPFRDVAAKYRAQQNLMESAKIQEALIHACGQLLLNSRQQDEVENDYWYEEVFLDGCHIQASYALADWAALIAEIQNGQDKLDQIERFVGLFVPDVYDFGSSGWEDALRVAIQSQSDAVMAIRLVDARTQGDDNTCPAGALLHLLGLTGDTDRFLQVARNAWPQLPHLALPLVKKLKAIGDRKSAIQVAEEAFSMRIPLSVGHLDQPVPHQDLLRFLIETLDPIREKSKLHRHADTLFFESGTLPDYQFLQNLMATQAERQKLRQRMQEKCSPNTVTEILNFEERWDELLAYAQQHVLRLPHCPQLLRSLHDRFPAGCFELYHQLVLDYLNRGTGQHLYDGIATFVRQMHSLPGQEDSFGSLMVWIHTNYQRRINLMHALGEFITIGFEWHNRRVQEAYKNLTPDDARAMNLTDLSWYCPLIQVAAKQADKKQQAAALIWAMLLQHGGSMEAKQISTVIAKELGIKASSASALRGQGLRLLEFLRLVEVIREHSRISQVNLLAELST